MPNKALSSSLGLFFSKKGYLTPDGQESVASGHPGPLSAPKFWGLLPLFWLAGLVVSMVTSRVARFWKAQGLWCPSVSHGKWSSQAPLTFFSWASSHPQGWRDCSTAPPKAPRWGLGSNQGGKAAGSVVRSPLSSRRPRQTGEVLSTCRERRSWWGRTSVGRITDSRSSSSWFSQASGSVCSMSNTPKS